MNSKRKNYPMKEFRAIFRFHRFWSSGPGMRKKIISQYELYFKMYGIYINFGCRFEFRTQKIPFERISGNFSDFTNFGHFWILAVLQNIWDLHKLGLRIWIQNAKITLWKNFGQFFRFHRFWSSGPGMQKKITSQY